MSRQDYAIALAQRAKAASGQMSRLSSREKIAVILGVMRLLDVRRDFLLEANRLDIAEARRSGVSEALLDRLSFSNADIDQWIALCRRIADLQDPIGAVSDLLVRPNGLRVGRMRVPIGVVLMVYEARPSVTLEASLLALKSGNSIMLRGGREAFNSNQQIARILEEASSLEGLSPDGVQFIDVLDYEVVECLVSLCEYVDVVVPRGGQKLITSIVKHARVPVIRHLDGVCHVYIDDDADPQKAIAIADNAKTQRCSTCNAMETLLISAGALSSCLMPLLEIFRDKGVEVRGCARTRAFAKPTYEIIAASEEDWSTEYLDLIISISVVDDMAQAIQHINKYGSGHTDAIVTENYSKSIQFIREVDSASVMLNASTRFADGAEYGLEAEIGISTDRVYRRGPVGLLGLTSEKWVVLGSGQIRS